MNIEDCSDDFVFDNQVIAQVLMGGYAIGELSCPTKYFADASSINFHRSLKYGIGCLRVAFGFRMAKVLPLLTPKYLRVRKAETGLSLSDRIGASSACGVR
jgi:hypothetical protein